MKKISTLILGLSLCVACFSQKTTILCDTGSFKPWFLKGNRNTNPDNNFVGTLDYQGLSFRTNNVERMRISPSGYIGINESNPSRLLSLQGFIPSDNAELVINQMSGSSLGAYLTLDNRANGGKWWSIGSTGTLNSPQVNGALEFYEYGYGTRMILDKDGNFGVNIGNGKLPTANFHTKGTLRFEDLGNNNALQRLLVTDLDGNVAWRDISTVIANSWSLTGNLGTNPANNFVGTTDYQNLALRTNNIERLTVQADGNIGINNSSPSKLLSINGIKTNDNAEIFVKQTAGSSLGAYLTLDNTENGGKWWSIGSTGTLNSPQVKGALEFYEFGFGTRMIMDENGNLGIGIGNGVLPTANLHAKGTVRLENLPAGSGTPLVIDQNGYLHVSSTALSSQTTDVSSQLTDLKKVISLMQTQIDNLSNQINSLKSSSSSAGQLNSSSTQLNILPNPSKGNTTIQYSIGDTRRSYTINIYDLSGRIIKTYALPNGETAGTIRLDKVALNSGVYGVSLSSQSEVLQNKFLIVN